MKQKNLKNALLLFIVSGAMAVTFYNCKSNSSNTTNNLGATGNSIFNFQASYQIPEDVDSNASDTALAAYAWQEFLALNWKSSYTSLNGQKGMPDTTWSYKVDTMAVPDTLVWETYAHRTELSPYTYPMRPFDSACNYSYGAQPIPGMGSPSFGLLHNLDETSEIGSCSLYAFADSQNLYNDSLVVRYQAKTNRTEYDYIKDSFPTQQALKQRIANTEKYIDSSYINPNYISDSLLLKLPNGSIEVKSAWRQLRSYEDPSKFLTRKVIVYSNQPVSGNTYTYTNKTYALIGLHIIHKSKNHPSFVFATWEHVDVMKDSMRYILISQGKDSLGYQKPIRNPIPAIDSLATAYVHANLVPNGSVWKNYRLVGVQGTPTSNTATPSFFLANYVIESDSLLARFHGSGFGSPFNGQPNVFYNHNLYSVGGCQGCHGGGAQHSGADFSFIVGGHTTAPDPVIGKPGATTSAVWKLSTAKLNLLKQKYHH